LSKKFSRQRLILMATSVISSTPGTPTLSIMPVLAAEISGLPVGNVIQKIW
jgi:hypothetical protein